MRNVTTTVLVCFNREGGIGVFDRPKLGHNYALSGNLPRLSGYRYIVQSVIAKKSGLAIFIFLFDPSIQIKEWNMTTESFSGDNVVWSRVKLPPWWLVLIEGILLIGIGIFFFISPYRTLVTAVWVLGLYWLIRGILDLVSLLWDRAMWGWKIFAGILGIVAGWILLQQPLAGSLVLSTTMVWLVAFIGLFIGISSLIRGFQGAGWGTIILGVFEIVLSIILFMNAAGAAAWMPWVLGGLAILGGILTLIAAFGLRGVEHQIEDAKEEVAAQAKAARTSMAATAAAAAAAADDAADEVDEVFVAERIVEIEEPFVQDLTAIEGIGPKTAAALQAAGVNNFADLAAMSPEQIHAIVKGAGISADPSTWAEQAELAAAGRMDDLKALQDKLQGGREA
jgi:uncharacterized membrane protein HdeD (DUF308 family)/predicted flap endonuclease-1-like 5' DNA nuclease